ncbi:hypothetical protein [Geobacillus sp. TFV-3]|uniref:hypothetical protein n=1 Tax=Geobacillus sp. TFV-3 TaxID=1897059 RepID=UPI001358AECC|nr:hypothetical protein [Geobacillus sp. TFV-3]
MTNEKNARRSVCRQRKTDFSDDPLAPKPYIKERLSEPPDSAAIGRPLSLSIVPLAAVSFG